MNAVTFFPETDPGVDLGLGSRQGGLEQCNADRNSVLVLAPRVGLEPTTIRLTAERSAN